MKHLRGISRHGRGSGQRLARSIGLGLLLLLLAQLAGAQMTWYAEKYASGDVPVRVEQLWSKGHLFRSEAVIAGHPIVTIVRQDQYIILDRLSRKGVSIQRSPAAMAKQEQNLRPFGNELKSILRAGAEFVRTEDFGGRKCDLYRLTNDQGRREVCVTTDDAKLPVLLRIWMRRSGREIEGRYINWTNMLPIDDSYFEPDPRIPLTKLSYEEYVARAHKDLELPAPPLYRDLLHGDGTS